MLPHGQKGFADVMKVIGLQVGGQSWIVWVGPISSGEFLTVENLSWLWSEEEVTMEEGQGRCEAIGFAGGGGGREPRNVGGMRKLEVVAPLGPPEEDAFLCHLDFSLGAPENCMAMTSCCFQPLSW